jgi:hypothetical protein
VIATNKKNGSARSGKVGVGTSAVLYSQYFMIALLVLLAVVLSVMAK